MNKRLTILSIIMFAIVGFTIKDTYGLFESEKDETVSSTLAKWVVKVNDYNVNEIQNLVIDKLNVLDNSSVKEGKLAPGTSGYCDIIIDPGDTDVSIKYELTFDFSQNTNASFRVKEIEELRNSNIIKTGETSYTGVLELTDIKNNLKDTIRIQLEWENDENNNEADSLMSSTKGNLNIPVTIKVSQYLGEAINEYIG